VCSSDLARWGDVIVLHREMLLSLSSHLIRARGGPASPVVANPPVSSSKHPIVRGWQRSHANERTITARLSAWPRANVGLVTGGPAHVVVLDIDGEDGRRSLHALEKAHERLPLTLTSATGGGGEQRLFVLPDELDLDAIGNSVRKLGAGLDVRASGGQIVVAPSLHRSGRRFAGLCAWRWRTCQAGSTSSSRIRLTSRTTCRHSHDPMPSACAATARQRSSKPRSPSRMCHQACATRRWSRRRCTGMASATAGACASAWPRCLGGSTSSWPTILVSRGTRYLVSAPTPGACVATVRPRSSRPPSPWRMRRRVRGTRRCSARPCRSPSSSAPRCAPRSTSGATSLVRLEARALGLSRFASRWRAFRRGLRRPRWPRCVQDQSKLAAHRPGLEDLLDLPLDGVPYPDNRQAAGNLCQNPGRTSCQRPEIAAARLRHASWYRGVTDRSASGAAEGGTSASLVSIGRAPA